MATLECSVCGGSDFKAAAVLWPDLIAQWQLSEEEVRYIDRQQGCACTTCGANLRLVALGDAIRALAQTDLPLRDAAADGMLADWRILDCNGAGAVSNTLERVPGYLRIDYPAYDMRSLPFDDGSFDLIIHSDTLEHIEHPVRALAECRRLLSPRGSLCFTVPIVVGRLSRDRSGLPLSFHGDAATAEADLVVQSEFGADAWTLVFEAGFESVALTQVDYPSAIAITASDAKPGSLAARAVAANPAPAAADVPAQPAPSAPGIYDQDGLHSIHNHEFMNDPAFQAAYARGVEAAGVDYHWHWRVHVGLWAASAAAKLPGDFVEFGVNRGFLSSAIMHLLDWNSTGRKFYLLDTFSGIDERYINDDDRAVGVLERNRQEIESGFYTFNVDEVRRNFAQWPGARIIAGPVPDTLPQIDSDRFAFAHIDMNCAPPEIAAAEFVWPRLAPGGLILLDDYAYAGYRSQKLAMDGFAAGKGVGILSLPTGQGLIVKPASAPVD